MGLRMACLDGERMTAWADILDRGVVRPGSADCAHSDLAGHWAATAAEVHRCLDELESLDGLPASRVVIGGFSQGAACAVEVALRHRSRVAGCVSVAGWLLPGARAAITNSRSRDGSFLVCHGEQDDKVDPSCSSELSRVLQDAGAQVQFKSFSGLGHTASQEEMVAVARFLKVALGRGKDRVRKRALSE